MKKTSIVRIHRIFYQSLYTFYYKRFRSSTLARSELQPILWQDLSSIEYSVNNLDTAFVIETDVIPANVNTEVRLWLNANSCLEDYVVENKFKIFVHCQKNQKGVRSFQTLKNSFLIDKIRKIGSEPV